ncbi:MAG TPA: peptide-methionine (S)-S-oxide reductase MsrA [Planctomycetaceae bacterium]|jgi:methionine-S-sulfoxide reductase
MQIRISTAATAVLAAILCATVACSAEPAASKKTKPAKDAKTGEKSAEAKPESDSKPDSDGKAKLEQATLGSGCFWCGEAVFEQLKGVKLVVSGYSGGSVPNPTYEQVSTGETGHAEVIEVTFDPAVISFEELLEVFWKSHDPTKLNEQGPDHGTQYRSAIFYHSEEQRETAEKSKKKHTKPGRTASKIVTEITKFDEFYPAEDYHQDFFKNNPRYPYCQQFVRPKVTKVKKEFKDQVKDAPEKK